MLGRWQAKGAIFRARTPSAFQGATYPKEELLFTRWRLVVTSSVAAASISRLKIHSWGSQFGGDPHCRWRAITHQ